MITSLDCSKLRNERIHPIPRVAVPRIRSLRSIPQIRVHARFSPAVVQICPSSPFTTAFRTAISLPISDLACQPSTDPCGAPRSHPRTFVPHVIRHVLDERRHALDDHFHVDEHPLVLNNSPCPRTPFSGHLPLSILAITFATPWSNLESTEFSSKIHYSAPPIPPDSLTCRPRRRHQVNFECSSIGLFITKVYGFIMI